MKLSQRCYRLLPMALTLAVATTCGCANTGSRRSSYLPYRKSAAASQPSLMGGQATPRTAQATPQSPQSRASSRKPPQMTPTTWNRPTPTTGPDPATIPAAGRQDPSARPAGSAARQAYFTQPAAQQSPSSGAAAAPAASGIQQMGYTVPAGGRNPFAAVEGRSARARSATAPAAAQTAAAPVGASTSAPYQWGTGTTGGTTTTSAGGQFLPPIQQ